jgi:ADP-heptose:LPS heptosyltransferase
VDEKPTAHRPPIDWAVIRLSSLGDAALTTGVLAHFGRRGLRFAVITRAAFSPLFENHPAVVEVAGLTAEQLAGERWPATCRELARRFPRSGLLDLHGNLRSRLLGLFWPGPVRRYPKFSLARRLFALTRCKAIGRRLLETNVPQRYALALDATPPPAEAVRPRIVLTDAEREAARRRMQDLGLNPPAIALHPFATHPDKAWPEGHWQALRELIEAAGLCWFVLGAGEAPLFPDSPRDLTGKTGLRETCALLAQAAALVTNDSGPMHLATAVGAPLVALFGPTTRAWGFFPSGPRDIVLERELPCRPCSLHGKKPCPRERVCLASIAPQEVLTAALSLTR